jgi:hypothetical protein
LDTAPEQGSCLHPGHVLHLFEGRAIPRRLLRSLQLFCRFDERFLVDPEMPNQREAATSRSGESRTGTGEGVVVEYSTGASGFASEHERLTRAVIARKLADLKGYRYAGEFDPTAHYPGAVYFVPSNTISGLERAHELGIRTEQDLFGGVVSRPFMATKAITHPLVAPGADAPEGWAHDFPRQVQDAVLIGFSVFALNDAHRAGECLLPHGPVRLKPVGATGGRGQRVVHNPPELNRALAKVDYSELQQEGLILEENLTDVTTYSVGQVRVADLVATYYGTQRLTPDNSGTAVYGGSDLTVVRGGFEALLECDVPDDIRLAVDQARTYDAAASRLFSGMFASRRNYDIAQGWNLAGRRSGVLEQSWRIGGASGAEIAALETFRTDPGLHVVDASTFEIFGESPDPPPDARVSFRGVDEQVGPITKYALVRRHGDA